MLYCLHCPTLNKVFLLLLLLLLSADDDKTHCWLRDNDQTIHGRLCKTAW